MKIQLSSLIHDSIVDGPGIRSVIFTQGCPHQCPGCHNPKAIPFSGGRSIDCDQVIEELVKQGHQKATFSGGEPFAQAEQLYYIAKNLKEKHQFNLWSYSGYTFEALMQDPDPYKQKLLGQLDILVDGPFLLHKRSIQALFRGSSNQRIIDVPASLKAKKAILSKIYTDQDQTNKRGREEGIFL